jgi:hypothetical protein
MVNAQSCGILLVLCIELSVRYYGDGRYYVNSLPGANHAGNVCYLAYCRSIHRCPFSRTYGKGYEKNSESSFCHCYMRLPKQANRHATGISLFPLIEEPQDLAGDMFPTSLFVIENTGRSCQDNVTKLTRGQQLDDPFLHVLELNVVARADNAGLVDAALAIVSKANNSRD